MGATVQTLGQVGDGCPDLLVGFMHINWLFECKNPAHPPSKRRLNAKQVKWHREWNGQVCIIETLDDALRAMGLI